MSVGKTKAVESNMKKILKSENDQTTTPEKDKNCHTSKTRQEKFNKIPKMFNINLTQCIKI